MIEVFYDNPEIQKKYEERVVATIKALRDKYGDLYVPILHDDMVEQMIRHQFRIRDFEKLIDTGETTRWTHQALDAERKQYNTISDKLLVSLKESKIAVDRSKKTDKNKIDEAPSFFNVKGGKKVDRKRNIIKAGSPATEGIDS